VIILGEKPYSLNFSLEGKTALITGAAKGIGKAIAQVFSEYKANIILVDLDQEVINVAKSLPGRTNQNLPIIADITKNTDLKRIHQESFKVFPRIDILVNNAGVGMLDDAENLSEEIWDKTMAVNLKAPFMLSQIIGREMIKQKKGKIINIASQAGLIALDKHVAYCSSKAGIIGMTKVLALEWAEYGINVNAIAPTVILTELGIKAWSGEV
jgi:NAD(P)-dependent dehydrogenase (short-subunit alcohol dehydrogenase family)